jgi:hypothetical protein
VQLLGHLVVDQRDPGTGANTSETLAAINALDTRLLGFAREMMQARFAALPLLSDVVQAKAAAEQLGVPTGACYMFGQRNVRLPPEIKRRIGLFQPPDHKN